MNSSHKKNAIKLDTQTSFPAVGDSLIVLPGISDPNTGIPLGGYQGRVTEVELGKSGQVTVTFQWDSLSLKNMPASAIRFCEEEGLDWTRMCLYASEIAPAVPRDRQRDVDKIIERLTAEHAWDYLGEQGQRIQQVLAGIIEDDENEGEVFERWYEHLQTTLKMPFEAEITEDEDHGPLHAGQHVRVQSFEEFDDYQYGILVNIKAGGRSFVFPLCDLEVVDKKSSQYNVVDDYATWFSNR